VASATDSGAWRLGTARTSGAVRPIIEIAGSVYALEPLLEGATGAVHAGPVTVLSLLQDWDTWLPALRRAPAAAVTRAASPLPAADVEWRPPVDLPGKLICAGTNYVDHLREMGIADPRKGDNPFAFVKPISTLLGAGRTLHLPGKASYVDWECELAVVIGRRGRDVGGEDVMRLVAGYTIFNDVSARDWIDKPVPMVGMDWILHKSFDGFGPIGPLITPVEHVPNAGDLHMTLSVNGEVKQDSSTAQMLFSVQEILEHLASVMTLEPGDVIATGSPAGVGWGRTPREWLHDGDEMVVRIEGLGAPLVTPVVR